MKGNRSLLLTGLLWLALLAVLLPLGLLIVWSFANRWPMPDLLPRVLTLRGWERLFAGYADIWQVTAGSILMSLGVGAASTIIAAMAARAVCLYDFPGRQLFQGAAMLPIIVPPTVFGMGSQILFIRLGISNTVWAVVIGHLIITLPFAFRTMLETTRLISNRLEEQARVLGASPGAAFVHGSLPALAPGLVSSLAISFLFSYAHYFLTLLLGGGRIQTLTVLVLPLIRGSDRTLSAVYAIVFIASAMGVFLVLQAIAARIARAVGKQLGGQP